MRRATARAAKIALFPSLSLVAVLLFVPERWESAVHVWLLALLSLAGLTGIAALRASIPGQASQFDLRAGAAGTAGRLPDLERVERDVSLAASSAYDVHYRLRPTLREITLTLLAAARGVSLDRQPARAHELLGDETWDLVRPDREAPADPRGPGLDGPRLERVVDSLESL